MKPQEGAGITIKKGKLRRRADRRATFQCDIPHDLPQSHAALIIEVPWYYSRGAVDLSIIRQAFTSWSHTAPHAEQVWRRVLGLLESRMALHMLHRQVLTAS